VQERIESQFTHPEGEIMRLIFALVLALVFFALPAAVSAQDKFFDSNGVQIRYVDQGSGEPIILIHGLNNTVETWAVPGILANLAKDYRVVAFDMRGHGKSGKPHDPRQYGREMGLDIIRLLDHLSIRRAHVVGYSLGAIVTAQVLTLHPDRFLTATLVAGSPRLEWTQDLARDAEQEASERERECVSRTLMFRLAPLDAPKPSEEAIKVASDACFANPDVDRFAIAALIRSRSDQVIAPVLASTVKVPTLAIVGNQDTFLTSLQALKELRPNLKLIVIDGATHSGPRGILTRGELTGSVREFISAHKVTK